MELASLSCNLMGMNRRTITRQQKTLPGTYHIAVLMRSMGGIAKAVVLATLFVCLAILIHLYTAIGDWS